MNKFSIVVFDKSSVEETLVYDTPNDFYEGIKGLFKEHVDGDEILESIEGKDIKLSEMIKLLNETFNYDDGDFWRLPFWNGHKIEENDFEKLDTLWEDLKKG